MIKVPGRMNTHTHTFKRESLSHNEGIFSSVACAFAYVASHVSPQLFVCRLIAWIVLRRMLCWLRFSCSTDQSRQPLYPSIIPLTTNFPISFRPQRWPKNFISSVLLCPSDSFSFHLTNTLPHVWFLLSTEFFEPSVQPHFYCWQSFLAFFVACPRFASIHQWRDYVSRHNFESCVKDQFWTTDNWFHLIKDGLCEKLSFDFR